MSDTRRMFCGQCGVERPGKDPNRCACGAGWRTSIAPSSVSTLGRPTVTGAVLTIWLGEAVSAS